MNKLLIIKHWQLFIVLTCTIFISIIVVENGLKIGDFDSLQLSSLIRVIGVIILFMWFLILGLSLNGVTNNPHKFKSGLFIAAILFCAFGYVNMNLEIIFSKNYSVPEIVTWLSPLLTLAGLVYVFYNLPKSLRSLETNKKVGFSDCIGDMFLLFAFPIGVWFTQPRINKLFMNSQS
jgi:hypothetical protein